LLHQINCAVASPLQIRLILQAFFAFDFGIAFAVALQRVNPFGGQSHG
jgi:hypothetical protein